MGGIARRSRDAWPWLPLVPAAVYAVLLVRSLGSVVRAIYLNGDIAAAPVIGELIGRAPRGASVVLGNIPWYTALWFEQLTHGLPDHRQIWEIAPWIITLIGIVILAWATERIAGRWAAVIVAVACACAGPNLLPLQFAWSVHAVSYVHICVLGASVALVATSSGWIGGRPWAHVAVLAVVALVTGLGIASDNLVVVAGLVPFVLAGGILAYVSAADRARHVLLSVLGVTAASVVVAELVKAVARSQNVGGYPFQVTFSPWNDLLGHVGDLIGSLAMIANGNFSGAPVSGTNLLAFVCAVVVAVGCYATLRLGRSMTLALASRGRGHRAGESTTQVARIVFLWFWLASALILSVAFVVSSVPVGVATFRYVVPVAYALIVVVTVTVATTGRTWTKALVTAGVSLVVAASAVGMLHRQIQTANTTYPNPAVAGALLRFAQSHGLSVGLSGYWDAYPLMWETKARLLVYPVLTCPGGKFCAFPYHRISSWYTPRPLARTFFVADPTLASANGVGGPAPSLGKPMQVAHIDQLTVYVYPYDIRSKILP